MLCGIVGIQSPTVIVCSIIALYVLAKTIFWFDKKIDQFTHLIGCILIKRFMKDEIKKYEKKSYLKGVKKIFSIQEFGSDFIKSSKFKQKYRRGMTLDQCYKSPVRYEKYFNRGKSKQKAVDRNGNTTFLIKESRRNMANKGEGGGDSMMLYRLYPVAKEYFTNKSTTKIIHDFKKMKDDRRRVYARKQMWPYPNVSEPDRLRAGLDSLPEKTKSTNAQRDVNVGTGSEPLLQTVCPSHDLSHRLMSVAVERTSASEIKKTSKKLNSSCKSKSKITGLLKMFTYEKLANMRPARYRFKNNKRRLGCCKGCNAISTVKKYSPLFTEEEKAAYLSRPSEAASSARRKHWCDLCETELGKSKYKKPIDSRRLRWSRKSDDLERLQKLILFRFLSSVNTWSTREPEDQRAWNMLRKDVMNRLIERSISEPVAVGKWTRTPLKSLTRSTQDVRREICETVSTYSIRKSQSYPKINRFNRDKPKPFSGPKKLEILSDSEDERNGKTKFENCDKRSAIQTVKEHVTGTLKRAECNLEATYTDNKKDKLKQSGAIVSISQHEEPALRSSKMIFRSNSSFTFGREKEAVDHSICLTKPKSTASLEDVKQVLLKMQEIKERIKKSKAIKHPVKSSITDYIVGSNVKTAFQKFLYDLDAKEADKLIRTDSRSKIPLPVNQPTVKQICKRTNENSPNIVETRPQPQVRPPESPIRNKRLQPEGDCRTIKNNPAKHSVSKIPKLAVSAKKPEEMMSDNHSQSKASGREKPSKQHHIAGDKESKAMLGAVEPSNKMDVKKPKFLTLKDSKRTFLHDTDTGNESGASLHGTAKQIKVDPDSCERDTRSDKDKLKTGSDHFSLNRNTDDDYSKGKCVQNESIQTNDHKSKKENIDRKLKSSFPACNSSRIHKHNICLREKCLNIPMLYSSRKLINKCRNTAEIISNKFNLTYKNSGRRKCSKGNVFKKLNCQTLLNLTKPFTGYSIGSADVGLRKKYADSASKTVGCKSDVASEEGFNERIKIIRETKNVAETLIRQMSAESLMKKIEERCKMFEQMSDDEILHERIILREYALLRKTSPSGIDGDADEACPGTKRPDRLGDVYRFGRPETPAAAGLFKGSDTDSQELRDDAEWLLNEVCKIGSSEFNRAKDERIKCDDNSEEARNRKKPLQEYLKSYSCNTNTLPKTVQEKTNVVNVYPALTEE